MLVLVPRAGAGRQVTYSNVQVEFAGEDLQFGFAPAHEGAIATASVGSFKAANAETCCILVRDGLAVAAAGPPSPVTSLIQRTLACEFPGFLCQGSAKNARGIAHRSDF